MAPPTPASDAGSAPRTARLKGWIRLVVIALAAAVAIRLFVAEAFRIPTPSMENTLLVGDYLLVSKLHYGPRTPSTVGLPLTDWALPLDLPPVRLPGFSEVARGDVVVFNLPTERGAVDRRTPFIKRVVGVPGDTVEVVRKVLRVNGEAWPLGDEMQQDWLVTMDASRPFSPEAFRALGIRTPIERADRSEWLVRMPPALADTVATWPAVARVESLVAVRPEPLFPLGTPQTIDDYGPVVVPRAGQIVALDGTTWPILRDVITRHEGHTARRFADGRFEIDGALAQTYAVEQDYYFVLGDSRDDSSDSRRWGFVPRDHLVGKAVIVYFSWDAETGRPRWERSLRWIR